MPKFPDLVKRNFTADASNRKWCGDITEIPAHEGKLYGYGFKRVFSGRLLFSEQLESESSSNVVALGALSLDAISSAVYGPKQTMVELLPNAGWPPTCFWSEIAMATAMRVSVPSGR